MSITVLKHAQIINFSPAEVKQDVDIVIEGTLIKAVGKDAASGIQADNVIDCDGLYVHPRPGMLTPPLLFRPVTGDHGNHT